MCALVGLMLLINRQFANALEYAIYWILSFPILVYTVRYGWKAALIPAVSMLLESLMLSAPTTVFYLASALCCGIGYGYGVHHHWKHSYLLLFTGAITLLSYFITTVLFASAFGYDIQEDILLADQMMQYFNLTNVKLMQLTVIITCMISILCAVLQTICIHLFAALLLKRMKFDTVPVKSVFDCTIPKWVGYISICIWLLFSLKNMLKLDGNLLMIVTVIYLIDCIILCFECVLDVLCISILSQKRIFGILFAFLCIIGLFFMPTRMIITWCGIISIHKTVRLKWKRGVMNGTIGKF